ncbi:DUF2619 domain-containing protein [Alicyclobacillus sp.]|uniref:DUF2619 domain-containing protein n=1 Tax=Alicyclobacillus sp. TaxID=61169 RepID=UPI0025BF234B|nr:DUF2619 domain-containing protein [Alicyclobacillus sp.]MCL6516186.1 YqhV family protein [Alicyclobacillus sp.]
MFEVVDKVVWAMAGMRCLSSLVELTGALLMLYFGTAASALQVNAALALVGPFVLVTVTMLGVSGLAGEIALWRIALIILGVGLILFAARG